MQNAVKPWYASQTVWGSVTAILAGIGGVTYGIQQRDTATVLIGVSSIAGGFHALVGRFKADTPIGRVLHQADNVVEAVAAITGASAVAGAAADQSAQ